MQSPVNNGQTVDIALGTSGSQYSFSPVLACWAGVFLQFALSASA